MEYTNSPRLETLEPKVILGPTTFYNYELLKNHEILSVNFEKKRNFTTEIESHVNFEVKKKKKKQENNVKYNLDFDIKKFIPDDEDQTEKIDEVTPKMSRFYTSNIQRVYGQKKRMKS